MPNPFDSVFESLPDLQPGGAANVQALPSAWPVRTAAGEPEKDFEGPGKYQWTPDEKKQRTDLIRTIVSNIPKAIVSPASAATDIGLAMARERMGLPVAPPALGVKSVIGARRRFYVPEPEVEPSKTGFFAGLVGAGERGYEYGREVGEVEQAVSGPTTDVMQKLGVLEREMSNIPPTQSYIDFATAKSPGQMMNALASDPVGILGQLLIESTAMWIRPFIKKGVVPALGGMALGGIIGAMTRFGAGAGARLGLRAGMSLGAGITSFSLERAGKIMEVLQQMGYDTTDPEQLMSAFTDKDVMAEAKRLGLLKGLPIAAFDAASTAFGGMFASRAKTALGRVARFGGEMMAGGGLGGLGEAAGEWASGEELRAGPIGAEVAADIAAQGLRSGVGMAIGVSGIRGRGTTGRLFGQRPATTRTGTTQGAALPPPIPTAAEIQETPQEPTIAQPLPETTAAAPAEPPLPTPEEPAFRDPTPAEFEASSFVTEDDTQYLMLPDGSGRARRVTIVNGLPSQRSTTSRTIFIGSNIAKWLKGWLALPPERLAKLGFNMDWAEAVTEPAKEGKPATIQEVLSVWGREKPGAPVKKTNVLFDNSPKPGWVALNFDEEGVPSVGDAVRNPSDANGRAKPIFFGSAPAQPTGVPSDQTTQGRPVPGGVQQRAKPGNVPQPQGVPEQAQAGGILQTPEEIAAYDPAQFAAWVKTLPESLQRMSIRLGRALGPAAADRLRSLATAADAQMQAVMASKDTQAIQDAMQKPQFFREAAEVASGKLSPGMQKIVDMYDAEVAARTAVPAPPPAPAPLRTVPEKLTRNVARRMSKNQLAAELRSRGIADIDGINLFNFDAQTLLQTLLPMLPEAAAVRPGPAVATTGLNTESILGADRQTLLNELDFVGITHAVTKVVPIAGGLRTGVAEFTTTEPGAAAESAIPVEQLDDDSLRALLFSRTPPNIQRIVRGMSPDLAFRILVASGVTDQAMLRDAARGSLSAAMEWDDARMTGEPIQAALAQPPSPAAAPAPAPAPTIPRPVPAPKPVKPAPVKPPPPPPPAPTAPEIAVAKPKPKPKPAPTTGLRAAPGKTGTRALMPKEKAAAKAAAPVKPKAAAPAKAPTTQAPPVAAKPAEPPTAEQKAAKKRNDEERKRHKSTMDVLARRAGTKPAGVVNDRAILHKRSDPTGEFIWIRKAQDGVRWLVSKFTPDKKTGASQEHSAGRQFHDSWEMAFRSAIGDLDKSVGTKEFTSIKRGPPSVKMSWGMLHDGSESTRATTAAEAAAEAAKPEGKIRGVVAGPKKKVIRPRVNRVVEPNSNLALNPDEDFHRLGNGKFWFSIAGLGFNIEQERQQSTWTVRPAERDPNIKPGDPIEKGRVYQTTEQARDAIRQYVASLRAKSTIQPARAPTLTPPGKHTLISEAKAWADWYNNYIAKNARLPTVAEVRRNVLGPDSERKKLTPVIAEAKMQAAIEIGIRMRGEPSMSPPDVGYHYGDGGVASDTKASRMDSGRSTGHFGTGTYFLGKPIDPKTDFNPRSNRPVMVMDLSGLTMLRPKTSQDAMNLHDGLKEFNRAVWSGAKQDFDTPTSGWSKALSRVWISIPGLTISKDTIADAMRSVAAVFANNIQDGLRTPSTYLVQKLGFNGIDVRGTDLDNTAYGSVIFVGDVRESNEPRFPATGEIRLPTLPSKLPEGSESSTRPTEEGIMYLVRQLPHDSRRVFEALIGTPMFGMIDKNKLRLALIPGSGGRTQNLGWIVDVVVGKQADPEIAPHEISHVIFDLMQDRDKRRIETLRQKEINRQLERADIYPQAKDILRSWINGPISSQAFKDINAPREFYHLINATEFLAAFFGKKFADDILSRETETDTVTLYDRVTDILRALWDWISRALGVHSMDSVFRNMLEGKYLNTVRGGIAGEVRYGLGQAITQINTMEEEGVYSGEEKAIALANLRLQQVAEPLAQLGMVQDGVGTWLAVLAQKNEKGDVRLTGEALEEMRRLDALVRVPIIRKFLVTPVQRVLEAARILGQATTTYDQFKNDPSVPPQMVAAAAGEGSQRLDDFRVAVRRFLGSYENKVQGLLGQAQAFNEEQIDAETKSAINKSLASQLTDIAKAYVIQAKDQASKKAYSQTLSARASKSVAVQNVINFVTANVDLTPILDGKIRSASAATAHVIATARQMVQEGMTEAGVIGATEEVVNDVMYFMVKDLQFSQRVADGQELIRNVVGNEPVALMKEKIGAAIAAGRPNEVLALLRDGWGETEAEKSQNAKLATILRHKVESSIRQADALSEAAKVVDRVRMDEQFRRLGQSMADDSGSRMKYMGLIKGVNTVELVPIDDGDESVTISLASTVVGGQENQKKLKAWIEKAQAYIADTDNPDYDPVKAAGLRAAINKHGILLNPAINPTSPGTVSGLPRTVLEMFFGRLGNFTACGQYVLEHLRGFVGEWANTVMYVNSTAFEQKQAIILKHQPRLDLLLSSALESHATDIGPMDAGDYRAKIYAPLAASMQSFANLHPLLKEGAVIGNGYVVTKEDIEFYRQNMAYEKEMIDMVNGIGARSLASIKGNPSGIITTKDGRTVVRYPFERGPGMLHRRLPYETAKFWEKWRDAGTDAEKIQLLNSDVDRYLFGYVADADNPDFRFSYRFGREFKLIMRRARETNNPISSFEDLTDKTYREYLDGLTGDEEEILEQEQVAGIMLDELNRIWARYENIVKGKSTSPASETSVVSVFGGMNSFTSERGEQIVPSTWYNYGVVGWYEMLGFGHDATSFFLIEHLNSLDAVAESLRGLIEDLRDKGLKGFSSVQARERGEIFYSLFQAKTLHKAVNDYRNWFNRYLRFAVEPKSSFENMERIALLDYSVSGLLTTPGAMIVNGAGGALNAVITLMRFRNTGIVNGMTKITGLFIRQMYREMVNVMFNENTAMGRSLYSMLTAPGGRAWFNNIVEPSIQFVDETRNLYRYSKQVGINQNRDLWLMMKSSWAHRFTGGFSSENLPDSKFIAKVLNPAASALRAATTLVRQVSVGFLDSRINMQSGQLAAEIELDLMNRAIDYGPERARLAAERGSDPGDLSNPANLFTAEELVGGRLSGVDKAAVDFRRFLGRYGINVDQAMHDFYKAYMDRRRAEGYGDDIGIVDGEIDFPIPEDMRLFTQDQYDQLVLGLSVENNQPALTNRPMAFRSNRLMSLISIFGGYPAMEMMKISAMGDRIAGQGFVKGHLKALPLYISALAVAGLFGNLAVSLSEWLKRKLLKRVSPFPTLFDDQTASSQAATILNGTSAMYPFYGSAMNMLIKRAYKTGFDLNTSILVLNLATDMVNGVSETLQTGEVILPVTRFANRWVFPFNYVAPRLRVMSGISEFTIDRHLIQKGMRQLGYESDIRAGVSRGMGFDIAPSSGLLQKWDNAIGNHDMRDAIRVYRELVLFNRKRGEENPELTARRQVSAHNPFTMTLKQKPSSRQLSQLFNILPAEDSAKLKSDLLFFNRAVQAVGGNPIEWSSDESNYRAGGMPTVQAMFPTNVSGLGRTSAVRSGGIRYPSASLRSNQLRLPGP